VKTLTRDFDLRYRPKVGDVGYYRLDIVYRSLDSLGAVTTRENWSGVFRRAVDAIDASGKVTETITWRDAGRRFADAGGQYGEREVQEWAEGFTYTFSAEDGYEDFHWDTENFPKDLYGWNVLLLQLDAHFEFDFLRSSRHGAIEKLTRVGDTVLTPDSNTPFWLGLPGVIDVPAFNKQNLRTTFVGLTRCHDAPCALLQFDMDTSPFSSEMMGMEIDSSSQFAGTLKVRLSDGALEEGEFLEWVFAMGGVINPSYTIERIDRSAFDRDC
jgi:hypothetical protein